MTMPRLQWFLQIGNPAQQGRATGRHCMAGASKVITNLYDLCLQPLPVLRYQLSIAQQNRLTNSHIAPILPADLEQGVGDLTQRAVAHGVHQHLKHIVIGQHRLLQALELRRCFLGMTHMKVVQPL